MVDIVDPEDQVARAADRVKEAAVRVGTKVRPDPEKEVHPAKEANLVKGVDRKKKVDRPSTDVK